MMEKLKLHDLHFEPFISAERIQGRIREMGQELSRRYRGRNPVFVAILNGAFVFAADLVRACDINCEVTFVKLSSYAGLRSSGRINEVIGLEMDIRDRPVLIVEDIIDSGRTLADFVPRLQSLGPASVEIICFLSKPEALECDLTIDMIGFEIPDRFVVGYGLDYNGLGRNLPDIYQLS